MKEVIARFAGYKKRERERLKGACSLADFTTDSLGGGEKFLKKDIFCTRLQEDH